MNYPLVIKVLGYTLWVEAGRMVLPLLFMEPVLPMELFWFRQNVLPVIRKYL